MRIQFNGKRVQISRNNRLMGGKVKNIAKTNSNVSNLTNEFERLYKSPAKKTKKLVLKL